MARRLLQLNIGRTETLARRSYRLFTNVFSKHKNDRKSKVDITIREVITNKNESVTPSSIREPDTDFCQAEFARQLEETENLENRYVITLKQLYHIYFIFETRTVN